MKLSTKDELALKYGNYGLPLVLQHIKDKMIVYRNNQTKLLVESKDLSVAQSAVVIRIVKVFDHFALGYTVDRLHGMKIPVTITYAALLDRADGFSYKVERTDNPNEYSTEVSP